MSRSKAASETNPAGEPNSTLDRSSSRVLSLPLRQGSRCLSARSKKALSMYPVTGSLINGHGTSKKVPGKRKCFARSDSCSLHQRIVPAGRVPLLLKVSRFLCTWKPRTAFSSQPGSQTRTKSENWPGGGKPGVPQRAGRCWSTRSRLAEVECSSDSRQNSMRG
jgi:hypothetical protein